ncbi:MAG TPA: hypothetical protein VGD30_16325 [Telluria sp.]
MGWLTNLTNWLKEQIVAVWHAFTTFINDTLVAALQTVADAVIYVLNHIPMPDWLAQYSLCALLSQTGPTVMWALDTFRIGDGLGLIALGYAFRLLRKFVTLFQW